MGDTNGNKPLVPSWPKRCRCGASYDEDTWRMLPFVGTNEDYGLEFRNCSCGSTLAVPLLRRISE